MTFVITETCIDTQDQACVDVCPVDCIHFEEGADRMLYINPVECIDCGACQPACPVTAIFPEGDVPAAQARFTEINSLWYEDAPAARAMVGTSGGAPAAAPAVAAVPAAEASADAPTAEGGEAVPAAAAAPAAKAAPVPVVPAAPPPAP
ncbi:MAG: ferredoxin family protein, partial [Chloroflexi bacterium]|nr:ferredoxin family protein [Chloroflexota bacterium]